MSKIDVIRNNLFSVEEKNRTRRFWFISFMVYALLEAAYSLVTISITRSMCSTCKVPIPFYISLWVFSLLFTGLLWYCLNLFYHKQRWILVVVNLFLFTAHYFSWISMLYIIRHSGQEWLLGKDAKPPPYGQLVYDSWFDIGKYVLKLSAFYVLKFYLEYRKSEQQRIELAILNKDLQLNLLKQQLSPHFYFNTLNNLYGLARSNSSKLPDALRQLSNIMQYVIVDCNQPKVLLSQEVNFLQSYIALEKLRYKQNTLIEMEVNGHANGQSILPLLLIQFVENAFKHGMKEKSEQNWMRVHITIKGEDLFFSVDNSHYEATLAGGIGIASVEHRLNLLHEGKYDMQMRHEGNRFFGNFKIEFIMRKINCAVIDDEPIAREILEDFIEQDERLQLQGNYKNAKDALKGISEQPVELVFLDINMPGLTGFQFLKSMTNPPAVIFTTAYREHAMEGFDANAIDYLLKPIAIERFLLAVNKAWKFLRPQVQEHTETIFGEKESDDFFFVKADGGLVKIFFEEILFIEALKEYVKIVTKDRSVITYHTISGLEEKLPAGKFYRIHRSYIVNIKAITSIEGYLVKVNKHELPVSRNERDAFVEMVASGKIISK